MIRRPAERYQFSRLREKMRARGEVLDFALGAHSHPAPEALVRLLREQPERALRRASAEEVQAFADEVVAMFARRYGTTIPADGVLAVPGGRTGMTALAAVLLSPGDAVVVTEPGYPAFAQVATQHHATVLRAPLIPETGFWPDLEATPGAEHARIAGLNYPNNPTGAVLSPDLLAALGTHLPADCVLFNDAAYAPLTYDGVPPLSLFGLLAEAGSGQLALELHSLSKLFGLGPMGLAYFVGSPELIGALRDYSDYAWAPPSSLQVQLARMSIADDEHLERVRQDFASRVSDLRGVLVELGLEPYPTPGGMYVLCRVPSHLDGLAAASANQAAEALLERFGLAVAAWDLPPYAYLRFSSLYRPAELAALAALELR